MENKKLTIQNVEDAKLTTDKFEYLIKAKKEEIVKFVKENKKAIKEAIKNRKGEIAELQKMHGKVKNHFCGYVGCLETEIHDVRRNARLCKEHFEEVVRREEEIAKIKEAKSI